MDHNYQTMYPDNTNFRVCCKKCINCGIIKCSEDKGWYHNKTWYKDEPACNEFLMEQIIK